MGNCCNAERETTTEAQRTDRGKGFITEGILLDTKDRQPHLAANMMVPEMQHADDLEGTEGTDTGNMVLVKAKMPQVSPVVTDILEKMASLPKFKEINTKAAKTTPEGNLY